jgi:hypothetical protein
MGILHKVGLNPIVGTARRLREEFKIHGVEEVFLVGGTSKSQRWFQPDMEAALDGLTVTYPAFPTRLNVPSDIDREPS